MAEAMSIESEYMSAGVPRPEKIERVSEIEISRPEVLLLNPVHLFVVLEEMLGYLKQFQEKSARMPVRDPVEKIGAITGPKHIGRIAKSQEYNMSCTWQMGIDKLEYVIRDRNFMSAQVFYILLTYTSGFLFEKYIGSYYKTDPEYLRAFLLEKSSRADAYEKMCSLIVDDNIKMSLVVGTIITELVAVTTHKNYMYKKQSDMAHRHNMMGC